MNLKQLAAIIKNNAPVGMVYSSFGMGCPAACLAVSRSSRA
jgi:hypothetical protein